MSSAPIKQRIATARPAFSYIARLTATATFAYLLALVTPAGTSRPVLAPLTALLVLQASLYQTIRTGVRKVASVTVGVLIAVGVAEFIGFSWWQLAVVIAGALLIGTVLRLGHDLLEVPISAMLIFSSAGPHAAATGRVVDTLVGTAAGLVGGLIFAAPRVQPAREAVGTMAGQLADLLSRMAADLAGPAGDAVEGNDGAGDDATDHDGTERVEADGQPATRPDRARVTEWLTQARALRDHIERVDDTLRQAADSIRLNPRSRFRRGGLTPVTGDLIVTGVALRGGLEVLEHATVTVRGLARSILDSAGIENDLSPVRDEQTRARLADVLHDLANAIRTYGRLVQAAPTGSEPLESQLAEQLEAAHRKQDELAAVLEPHTPAEGGSSEWPLRGEILTHVDRLRTGLRPDAVVRPQVPRPLPGSTARTLRRSLFQRERLRPERLRPGRLRPERAGQERAQRDRVRRERGHRVRVRRRRDPAGGR